jgi:hypothetical protein
MTAIISPTEILISESDSASKAYSTFINFRFRVPFDGRGGRTAESVCVRRRAGDVDCGGDREVLDLYFVVITGRGLSGRGGTSSSGE